MNNNDPKTPYFPILWSKILINFQGSLQIATFSKTLVLSKLLTSNPPRRRFLFFELTKVPSNYGFSKENFNWRKKDKWGCFQFEFCTFSSPTCSTWLVGVDVPITLWQFLRWLWWSESQPRFRFRGLSFSASVPFSQHSSLLGEAEARWLSWWASGEFGFLQQLLPEKHLVRLLMLLWKLAEPLEPSWLAL